jgi:ABC-type bacteriocin/lantibiotic exporter with double-glycine peptidase domain
MRGALARAALILALALPGCMHVPSSARAASPAEIASARGWVSVGAITPVRQKSALDCGPAALTMVARHWGVELRLDDANRAARRPTGRGARLGALRDVARARGLAAFAIRGDRKTIVHELERGRPVVVGLLRGTGRERVSHFEVVVGHHPRRGEVATIDPAAGLGVRRWRDLTTEWDAAGRPTLIVLGPEIDAVSAAGARR